MDPAGRNVSEHRAGLEMSLQKLTRHNNGEGRGPLGSERDTHQGILPG